MSENGETGRIGAVIMVGMNLGMSLDTARCYQALLTHDARFDGVFFVGVSTTRIYCRTVCTARTPRPDRCTFFPSAAAAERAGFRPCLRCRPELAPGAARLDSGDRLASEAAAQIEAGSAGRGRRGRIGSREIGVSERHLRRIIAREFGVSPVQLAQTQRLLLAKRLLTDTGLPVGEVAFASGFSSLRRFNALFQERYRLNPTDLRRSRPSGPTTETLVCEVSYRPPLEWDSLLAFLVGRRLSGRRGAGRAPLPADGPAGRKSRLDRGRACSPTGPPCASTLSVSGSPQFYAPPWPASGGCSISRLTP